MEPMFCLLDWFTNCHYLLFHILTVVNFAQWAVLYVDLFADAVCFLRKIVAQSIAMIFSWLFSID